ncbi:hypothetical protein GJ633_10140 [Halorubrum sp. CBA1125]|uniref:hypothetical protein n=1 Tax=Halorubrum sp. CBA1125 TaxID=2668072 RepID=UPI0012E8D702|nr:hypothetical protein [Halorubrum sp. CBA1125]MUW14983.1 hypothetical protein [Halorubrum sp. CBA1125]
MFDGLVDPGLGVGVTAGVGSLLTAGVLGVTHGIEPDHVAGITALTHEAGDPRLSALVGGCFAVGHAILVVVWVAVAYALFGVTSFPATFDRLGTLFVGGLLALLSLYLGVTGVRKLRHRRRHARGDDHSHSHVLPASLRPTHDHGTDHDEGREGHEHTTFEYLKIGTVGALFTLSPPVSMIAFVSVALPNGGAPLAVGVVAAYAVTIVATMALIGGGAGSLFRVSKRRSVRLHAVSQVVASVLVLAFAVDVLAGLAPGLPA